MPSIQDTFRTVAIRVKNGKAESVTLYEGFDAALANAACEKSVDQGTDLEVGVIPHPQVTFTRRPAEEARQAKERMEQATRDANAAVESKKVLARLKTEQAEKLKAEAAKLTSELAAAQKAPKSASATPEPE